MLAEHRTICPQKEFATVELISTQNPFLKLLSCLFHKSVFSDNCFSVDNLTKQRESFSSPFVTAIAGLVLRKIDRHPTIQNCLSGIRYHLIRCFRTDPVINFFHDSEHNHDLDTFTCVNLFLLSENQKWLDRNMLIDTIAKNKCQITGGYKTWFDRDDNNIDFFVNLNTYVLFNRLSYEDESLCDFLKNHIDEFLSKGSPYYKNIEFPLFLIFFYWKHEFVEEADEVFSKIISSILKYPSCKSIVDNMFQFYGRKDRLKGQEETAYKFQQYFNCSTKSFHSPVLDTMINAYLFCQNGDSYCETNR